MGMNNPIHHRYALLGGAATIVTAVFLGWLSVVLVGDGHTTEYGFLITWSLPPGGMVYAFVRRGGHRVRRLPLAVQSMLWTLAGATVGVGWTFLAYFLTGGYLLAADFPVMACWTLGAIAGILVGVHARATAGVGYSTAMAIPFVALVAGASIWANRLQPELRVVVHPDATPQEIQLVWQQVIGSPSPTGIGYSLPGGVRGVSRAGVEGDATVLIVTFDPFASGRQRTDMERQLRTSPLISRYEWVARSSRE
jgi:hypothetical protein